MQDLCSKCYRDLQLNEQQSSSAKLVLNQTLAPPSSLTPAIPQPCSSSAATTEPVVVVVAPSAPSEKEGPSRCATCRRRVGLTGFKCRCGLMLCGSHRYPEKHECGFDFKELGREQIAKANPVVKGEKLNKI